MSDDNNGSTTSLTTGGDSSTTREEVVVESQSSNTTTSTSSRGGGEEQQQLLVVVGLEQDDEEHTTAASGMINGNGTALTPSSAVDASSAEIVKEEEEHPTTSAIFPAARQEDDSRNAPCSNNRTSSIKRDEEEQSKVQSPIYASTSSTSSIDQSQQGAFNQGVTDECGIGDKVGGDRQHSASPPSEANTSSSNSAGIVPPGASVSTSSLAHRWAQKLREYQEGRGGAAGLDESNHSHAMVLPSFNQKDVQQQLGNKGGSDTAESDEKSMSRSTITQLPAAQRLNRKSRPTNSRRRIPSVIAASQQGDVSLQASDRLRGGNSFHLDGDVLLEPSSSDAIDIDAVDSIANNLIRYESLTSVGRRFGFTHSITEEDELSVLSFAASFAPTLVTSMEEANLPHDQPGAFAARGRAFGEYPMWGRTDLEDVAESSGRRRSSFTGWLRSSISRTNALRSIHQGGDNQSEQAAGQSREFGYDATGSEIIEASLVESQLSVVYASDVVSDEATTKFLRRKYTRIFALLGLIITGLAIGLTFLLSTQDWDLGVKSEDASEDYKGDLRCLLSDEEKDVFGHCVCHNTTDAFVMSEAEDELYIRIRQLLFDEQVTNELYFRSSCDPANTAILWTANYERIGLLPIEVALAPPRSIIQRFVLAYIFITMNGENWVDNEGWMQEKYTCDWSGVTCSFLERISEIDLSSQGLIGTLPAQLGRMPFLRVLDLSQNRGITGHIPNELASNPSLHEIDVSNNQLTGSIPIPLIDSGVLDRLILSNNTFTGTIPSEIGRFSRMRQLSIDNNRIQGSIPEEIGALINLEVLELAVNEMTGFIPDSLKNLVFLEQIELDSNSFSGTIPTFMGSAFPNLETLFIYDNMFTGTVPEIFCEDDGGRRDFCTIIATCSGNQSVTPSCSCCLTLVYCFEQLPPSLQDSV